MTAEGAILLGDCLERIAEATAAVGPFDLVYVDPPFAAGGTRSARLAGGLRSQGTAAYEDHFGGIDGFLDMMSPRLEAMYESLSTRGSLWIHLDYRAVHDVKVLCDRLFGRTRFEGEIIWSPGNGGRRKRGPSVTHQTILVYARSKDLHYVTDDPDLREPYAATSQSMHFRLVDETGRRFRERIVGGKAYRYYADQGRKLGSVWSDLPSMRANTPLREETTGYPTQKPLGLLDRIVRLATPLGGAVLDPMCGSGTTIAAALLAGRRAIGIDQSDVAVATARHRWEKTMHSAAQGV
jgi:site-specific DNA-methyltransferase (adenine-specific)